MEKQSRGLELNDEELEEVAGGKRGGSGPRKKNVKPGVAAGGSTSSGVPYPELPKGGAGKKSGSKTAGSTFEQASSKVKAEGKSVRPIDPVRPHG